MKKYINNPIKKLIILRKSALVFTLFFSTVSVSCQKIEIGGGGTKTSPNAIQTTAKQFNYIFKERTNNFQVYRIPAIAKSKAGTILAFAEARTLASAGDSGNIDLVLRRSLDNGKTWEEMITVWNDGANTCGNPVPIVDEETGEIHLLMNWNNGADSYGEINNLTAIDTRRVFYTKSTDDGKTWQTPREITSSVKNSNWRWHGVGPCHGIQIKEGTYKGRLVAPCYYYDGTDGKTYSNTIVSDDKGLTWKISGTTQEKGGECTIAELTNAKLMLNIRTNSNNRLVTTSTNGSDTWADLTTDYALIDPQCQGSLLSYPTNGGGMNLFFANAASAERVNMTIKQSLNEGGTWPKVFTVHAGPSAYSDLVKISDTEIAILYEGGIGRPYEGISFEIVKLTDFK
jgi:sialidase-1